ncbi:hypothetical protein HUT18_20905 [Streptomyces sp. NA04227]|uniref:hypothetical protein n=1 Tax=Streptomyces sp. NA04227 TaxID=2742136 RepID=UPI001592AF6C|nr:hypothetical protein [Streptomyces sp. NA04227]QKW08461.1 hypothetical protein HUT18_20905 [Streptomyces sp. NA04227]
MAGSAKPGRRRAAAAAYRPGRSVRTPGPGHKPDKARKPWGQKLKDGGFVALCITGGMAVFVGLVLGPGRLAADWWHEVAPHWPGAGYGFALTVGGAWPLALTLAIWPLTRTNFKLRRARSVVLAATSVPGWAACVMLFALSMQTLRPKSRRGRSCSDGDSSFSAYCWVHAHAPYAWAVILLGFVLGAALLVGAELLRQRLGRSSSPQAEDSPAPSVT